MEEKVNERTVENKIPWTVGDIAKGIGLAIGFLFLISIVTAVVLVAIAISMVGLEGIEQLVYSTEFVQYIVIASLIGSVVLEGWFFFTAWLFSLSKYHCSWGALGFRSFNLKRALILVPMVLVVGVLVNILYEMLITALGLGPSEPAALPIDFTQNGLSLAIFIVLSVVLAPFAEETFFRGFVFAGIGNRYGYGWGAVASALLFALPHILTYMHIWVLLPIFILGLFLAWLYHRTGSIWPCIITHFAYNSIALIFMII